MGPLLLLKRHMATLGSSQAVSVFASRLRGLRRSFLIRAGSAQRPGDDRAVSDDGLLWARDAVEAGRVRGVAGSAIGAGGERRQVANVRQQRAPLMVRAKL